MQEKRCAPSSHNWSCEQAQGMLGELKTKTPLSASQVGLIIEDPSQIDVVCPGGRVVCGHCRAPFDADTELVPFDFPSLTEKLLRPNTLNENTTTTKVDSTNPSSS